MSSSSPGVVADHSAVAVSRWKRAVVYGMGGSGIAASRLLLENSVSVVGVDDRTDLALPASLNSAAEFELLPAGSELAFDDVDGVVVSPGVPVDSPLLERARTAGLAVLSELELAFQVLNDRHPAASTQLMAVTGSNGKSTVVQLASELLGEAIPCGNFGEPLSDCVRARMDNKPGPLLAVEVSSFQLETVAQFHPKAAALLNISDDHLDRHGDLETYVALKRRLFDRQGAGDVAILNADDPVVAETQLPQGVRRREFSLATPVQDGCYLDGDRAVLVTPGGEPVTVFRRDDLSVVGHHNLANAMAALLLADAFDVELSEVPQRLSEFRGLPHRTQLVAEHNGVAWFDDSKGTNIGATVQSLLGFADGTVHLIAGGRAKGSDFSELREIVGRKVAHLYLVGEAADQISRELAGAAPAIDAGTIDVAVRSAAERAQSNEVVLLSPACASFDQFASYVERGEFFQRAVRSRLGLSDSRAVHDG